MLLAESPRLHLQLPEPLPVASQQSTEKQNLPECQIDDPKKRFRLPGSNYFRLKQFQIGKQRRKITRPVSAVHLFGKWHRPTSGMGFSKMLGPSWTIWRNTHIPTIFPELSGAIQGHPILPAIWSFFSLSIGIVTRFLDSFSHFGNFFPTPSDHSTSSASGVELEAIGPVEKIPQNYQFQGKLEAAEW